MNVLPFDRFRYHFFVAGESTNREESEKLRVWCFLLSFSSLVICQATEEQGETKIIEHNYHVTTRRLARSLSLSLCRFLFT